MATNLLQKLIGKLFSKKSSEPKSVTAGLRPLLGGGAQSVWVSDHFAECVAVTDLPFVAIRAVAKQCAQAVVCGYKVEQPKPSFERGAAGPEAQKPLRSPLSPRHPLIRILTRPNPYQSGSQMRFAMAQQFEATGTALVWAVRNGMGVPVELYVIPTALATPVPGGADMPMGAYRVAPMSTIIPNADNFTHAGYLGGLMTTGGLLDARDVRAIRWPHPLFLGDGLSPMHAGRLTLDVANQLNRSRVSTFKNAVQPGLVLSTDANADMSKDDKDALRVDLRNRNAGTMNAGKDLVLPPGVTAEQMQKQTAELDYADSYPQVKDAVLGLFGTPGQAVGQTESASYASFFASLLQFNHLTVEPILDLFAEELCEFLAAGFGYDSGEIELQLKAQGVEDPSLEENRLKTIISSGAVTYNEFRARIGYPPLPGPEGDELMKAPQPQANNSNQDGSGIEKEPADSGSSGSQDPARQNMPKYVTEFSRNGRH